MTVNPIDLLASAVQHCTRSQHCKTCSQVHDYSNMNKNAEDDVNQFYGLLQCGKTVTVTKTKMDNHTFVAPSYKKTFMDSSTFPWTEQSFHPKRYTRISVELRATNA